MVVPLLSAPGISQQILITVQKAEKISEWRIKKAMPMIGFWWHWYMYHIYTIYVAVCVEHHCVFKEQKGNSFKNVRNYCPKVIFGRFIRLQQYVSKDHKLFFGWFLKLERHSNRKRLSRVEHVPTDLIWLESKLCTLKVIKV